MRLNTKAKVTVMGIDLSASEKRCSGVCILRDLRVKTLLVKTDEELLSIADRFRPEAVAIDAPLSLPADGDGKGLRQCDRKLLKRGIRLFPITFRAMSELARRGIALKEKLEAKGFQVIEVFPGGAQDLLGLPRKHHNLDGLREGLKSFGIKGLKPKASGDEIDAVTAAFVGWLWLNGFAELVEDSQGKGIVMPPLGFKCLRKRKPSEQGNLNTSHKRAQGAAGYGRGCQVFPPNQKR
ncbi:MAG: DUF429 domain-containing protein [Candidatus Fervidibacter sp.]|uniref:DUF429 domain-containing protein n=1 Tax=Candidatus Fervidibacter sp. TaxID=3100871 RepID=UPI0040493D94